jgi:hypothetical protein
VVSSARERSALEAELGPGRVLAPAAGTARGGERRPAFQAELGPFRIVLPQLDQAGMYRVYVGIQRVTKPAKKQERFAGSAVWLHEFQSARKGLGKSKNRAVKASNGVRGEEGL